jgi:maltose O-acetyltransferase
MGTSSGHIPDAPLKQLTPLPEPFYWPQDETLTQHRQNARVILRSYNLTATVALPGESMPEIEKRRAEMLGKLFGKIDIENPPFIEPPFQCDYGYNIECGSKTYMNFGCVILDCAKVTIGDKCLFGPNVQIYCPGHPLDPVLRNGFDGPEYAEPISIGNDVWVGGNAIILSGVTIGDGAVVGAGSVVTKNVESMTVVAGNPAKLIRKIEKGDMGHRKWNWAAMK